MPEDNRVGRFQEVLPRGFWERHWPGSRAEAVASSGADAAGGQTGGFDSRLLSGRGGESFLSEATVPPPPVVAAPHINEGGGGAERGRGGRHGDRWHSSLGALG